MAGVDLTGAGGAGHHHGAAAGSPVVESAGHDHGKGTRDRHDHGAHAELFARKFRVSLGLTAPTVVYSSTVQRWLGYAAPRFPGHTLVAPAFGTLVFLWGGPVFLRGARQELSARQPGMMTLISTGLIVAFGASVATEAGAIEADMWFELSTLVTVMLLGHWLEMRAIGQAQGALAALAALLPDEAERLVDNEIETVPVGELAVGDVILVRPGGRVAADGVIVEGQAELDESMITGESRPVPKARGAKVVAGTVSTDSSIRVAVQAVGADTAVAGIQRLVEEAQASRSRAQALADRFAALLFYVAVASGLVTFAVWAGLGHLGQAVERAVTVVVIACPHALGLAIPLTIAVSTAVSARAGILVKERLALERMRTIGAVLFDKTGTLTTGEHTVTAIAGDGLSETDVLALAAAVEADSEHPLARAIVDAAGTLPSVPLASGFRSAAGRGVHAVVDGEEVAVGGPALLREQGLLEPASIAARSAEWRARGASVLHVVRNGRIVGAVALEDAVRPESRPAVDGLHALGMRVVMITGDARPVAQAVAGQLGVDEVMAEVLPEDKERAVADLQARGLGVAMVGDGVNDAPALARADVGIAIGAGTDVAIESAGVILASSDPRGVLGIIRLSRASYRKMVQNLGWGAGYNVVAIPLAAGVLSFAGVTLSPAAGAFLMSASTIVVASNAQLLRGLDLRPVPPAGAGTERGAARAAMGTASAG